VPEYYMRPNGIGIGKERDVVHKDQLRAHAMCLYEKGE